MSYHLIAYSLFLLGCIPEYYLIIKKSMYSEENIKQKLAFLVYYVVMSVLSQTVLAYAFNSIIVMEAKN
jgi:hypothetical protein